MSLFSLFHQKASHERKSFMTEDMREKMKKSEGDLAEAIANHRIRMDWARKLAKASLNKLDEGSKN